MGSKLKAFFIIVGILACLGIGSRFVELKNPHQPRIIDPSYPVKLPHVSVSKR